MAVGSVGVQDPAATGVGSASVREWQPRQWGASARRIWQPGWRDLVSPPLLLRFGEVTRRRILSPSVTSSSLPCSYRRCCVGRRRSIPCRPTAALFSWLKFLTFSPLSLHHITLNMPKTYVRSIKYR
jgi:hypothetical protein